MLGAPLAIITIVALAGLLLVGLFFSLRGEANRSLIVLGVTIVAIGTLIYIGWATAP